jgi:hypothetical protein
VTEILITLKFDWELITKPLPRHIGLAWIIGLVVLLMWTLWHFYLQRLLWHTESKLQNTDGQPEHTNNNKISQRRNNKVYQNGSKKYQ